MHRIAALSGVAGLLLLTACNTTGTVGDSDSSSSSSSTSSVSSIRSSSSSSMAATTSSATSTATSSVTTGGTEARVIAMTSSNWEFSPITINAAKGEKIIVRLTNDQGIHSFGSMDLGLNIRINPGETKDIVIPTDKAGTFEFRCMVPCGPGHKDMKGTIVIS